MEKNVYQNVKMVNINKNLYVKHNVLEIMLIHYQDIFVI